MSDSEEIATIGTRLRRTRRTKKHVLETDSEEEGSDGEYNEPKKKKTTTSSRRRKTRISGNIDDFEDWEENHLFEALSSPEVAISELAADWIDDFTGDDTTKSQDATKDLVNFVLRSCGCVSLVERHDVADYERADKTIAEVQQLFISQDSHEFALLLGARAHEKQWKGFKSRACEFFRQVLLGASERGVLYEDESFLETILAWLASMSTTQERSLRYTATFYSLQVESALCEIYVQTAKFISRCQRQLKSNAGSGNKRVERIQANYDAYVAKRQQLETMVNNVFHTFFVHRYRDANAEIRRDCIACLGDWMRQLPELFFKPVYLRYFGWLLTDTSSTVRLQVLKSLLPLYEKPSTVSALRQFTSHFLSTFLKMPSFEKEGSIRTSAIALLSAMVQNNFLEDSDVTDLTALLFTEDSTKVLKELGKFVSCVEQQKCEEFVEANGASIKACQEDVELSLEEMLKFKTLCKVLEEAQKDTDVSLDKYCTIAQTLYSVPRYNMQNRTLQFLLDLLVFDSSSLDGIDASLKEAVELTQKDQFLLLVLVYGICATFMEGDSSPFFRTIMSRKSSKVEDRGFYLVQIINRLPKLVDYFSKNSETLSAVVLTACCLLENETDGENVFRSTNQEPALLNIVNSLIRCFVDCEVGTLDARDFFLEHTAPLDHAFGLFFSRIPSGYPEVSLKMEEVVSALCKTLQKTLDDNDVEQASATLVKLRLLQPSAKLCVGFSSVAEQVCLLLKEHPVVPAFEMLRAYVQQIVRMTVECARDGDISAQLERLLPTVGGVIGALEETMNSTNVDTGIQFRAACDYAELMGQLLLTKKHLFTSDYTAVIRHVCGDWYETDKLPESAQNTLLRLFKIRELQYATLLDKDSKLDIPGWEEDVEMPESDSDLTAVQSDIFALSQRMLLLSQTGVADSQLRERASRNVDVLGEVYKQSLIDTETDTTALLDSLKQ